jgi:hypothetical protein
MHALVGSIPRPSDLSLDRAVQMKNAEHETCHIRPVSAPGSFVIENEGVIIERVIVGPSSRELVVRRGCSNLRIEADSAPRIR